MMWFLVGLARVVLVMLWCVFAGIVYISNYFAGLVEWCFEYLQKRNGYEPLS